MSLELLMYSQFKEMLDARFILVKIKRYIYFSIQVHRHPEILSNPSENSWTRRRGGILGALGREEGVLDGWLV